MHTTNTATQPQHDDGATAQSPMNTRVALRELLVEMKGRDDLLIAHINKRHRFDTIWTIAIGVAAAVVGAYMFGVIISMSKNMDTMAHYMQFMESMQKDMEIMRDMKIYLNPAIR